MPADSDFRSWAEGIFTHHERGEYQAALALVRAAAPRFPGRSDQIAYWEVCFLCRLGESDQALSSLRTALDAGQWWSPDMLRRDPDLEPLRDQAATSFAEIVAACETRLRNAQSDAKPGLRVVFPDSPSVDSPLLIALHWRARHPDDFAAWWLPAVAHGAVVAFPRSSLQIGPHAFAWDDPERAEREIGNTFAQLRASTKFDPDKVILSGASQGGDLAIRLALAGTPIPCRGFVAVVPAVRDVAPLLPLLDGAAQRGLRGWLLTGERDYGRAQAETLHAEMVRYGLACELVVVPGLEHDFSLDFEERLPAALDFVLA